MEHVPSFHFPYPILYTMATFEPAATAQSESPTPVPAAAAAAVAAARQSREGSVSSQLSGVYEFLHQDIHAACPEKIILCVDLSQEVESTTVKSKEKGEISLLSVWKNALELFVWNKSALNEDHEFAIVFLTDTAQWFCEPNKDPTLVCQAISQMQTVGDNYDSFDTAALYSLIYENCPPPPASENPNLPPPFVVRAILLYGRSHSMPVYKGDVTAHDKLITSPYFFLDVLYSHEPPSTRNMCAGIFDILAEMYPKPKQMVLDWSHSVAQLFNCFAKLLGHPLQRPTQTNMEPRLES